MRLWIVLICTVIALQSMVVRSETWSCSYQHGGEPKVFVLKRVEGGFTDPTSVAPVVDTVLKENDRVIHLYSTVSEFGTYFATLLSKENKTFSMVSLGPEGNSNVSSGPCRVY